MSKHEIKKHIESLCSHLTFEWNGKECGVDPLSATEFDMWCGGNQITSSNIEEVMNTQFFDGFSLNEIADKIQNIEM